MRKLTNIKWPKEGWKITSCIGLTFLVWMYFELKKDNRLKRIRGNKQAS